MFSGQIEFSADSRVPVRESKGVAFVHLSCCISERLHLRSLKLEDTHPLFSLTDANREYLRQWLPWLDANLHPEDTRAFIERSIENMQAGKETVSAIFYDRTLVGLVGLHEVSWHHRSGCVGYWLSADYQGKGIMTRACQSMLDYGFATLKLNRIEICCAVNNARSEAVVKRLGLAYEGTLREAEWLYDHFVDWKVYSMLAHEWAIC